MNVIKELEALIKSRSFFGQRTLIGIDGFGGTGKSSLADKIVNYFPNSSIIHIDDFYKVRAERDDSLHINCTINPNYDWDRLEQEVLTNFFTQESLSYQRYDWNHDRLEEFTAVPASIQVVIIEGVYALQSRFNNLYNFKIWVSAPEDLILQRAVDRDGADQLYLWTENWIPRERHYFKIERPDKRADTVVKGY